MFTKIGSFLGSVAFVMLMALTFHVYSEEAVPPPPTVPTLVQQLASVVDVNTGTDYCSGWVLKGSKIVVTAAHCADKTNPTQEFNVDFHDGTGNHVFHIRKLGDDMSKDGPDLMTLISNDPKIKWPVGLDTCSFKPYYGESINLIGGPLGYSQSTTFGKVSNPDRNMDDAFMGTFGHFIQYDGAMAPGNSGGPAIDSETGCVMGVADFLITKDIMGHEFDLMFLTPSSELAAIQ
jgi:S1-C subfamily serine protease